MHAGDRRAVRVGDADGHRRDVEHRRSAGGGPVRPPGREVSTLSLGVGEEAVCRKGANGKEGGERRANRVFHRRARTGARSDAEDRRGCAGSCPAVAITIAPATGQASRPATVAPPTATPTSAPATRRTSCGGRDECQTGTAGTVASETPPINTRTATTVTASSRCWLRPTVSRVVPHARYKSSYPSQMTAWTAAATAARSTPNGAPRRLSVEPHPCPSVVASGSLRAPPRTVDVAPA